METIDYFLRRYREDVISRRKASGSIEDQLAAFEAQLRGRMLAGAPVVEAQQVGEVVSV